ncbi:MAG: conjugative transposon protein TraM [Bacteroidota bacterium]
MIEKIDNPERFEKKVTWKGRVVKFLRKNIYYIPFVLFFVALGSIFWIYREELSEKFSLEVAYDQTIDLDEYVMKGKDNLSIMKDKLTAKERAKKNGRYEKFVSGRDVVSVNFGEVIWSDEKEEIQTDTTQVADTTQVDTSHVVPPKVRTIIKYIKVPEPAPVEDTVQIDTIEQVPILFASIALEDYRKQYVQAFIYGDQEIADNSLVRFRLAEELTLANRDVVPAGTVFRGKANMSQNVVTITVDRIAKHNVSALIYDRDYSLGIILNRTPNDDMNEALNRSLYLSGDRSLTDIPVGIAQDVTRNIIRNRRQKDRIVKFSDGDRVYIALNQ